MVIPSQYKLEILKGMFENYDILTKVPKTLEFLELYFQKQVEIIEMYLIKQN